MRTVDIVMKNIGLKFGTDRCGVLAMKRGREVKCNGISWKIVKKLVRLEKKDASTLVFWRKTKYVRRE